MLTDALLLPFQFLDAVGEKTLPILDEACWYVRESLFGAEQAAVRLEARVADFHMYVRRWRLALDGTDGWLS